MSLSILHYSALLSPPDGTDYSFCLPVDGTSGYFTSSWCWVIAGLEGRSFSSLSSLPLSCWGSNSGRWVSLAASSTMKPGQASGLFSSIQVWKKEIHKPSCRMLNYLLCLQESRVLWWFSHSYRTKKKIKILLPILFVLKIYKCINVYISKTVLSKSNSFKDKQILCIRVKYYNSKKGGNDKFM